MDTQKQNDENWHKTEKQTKRSKLGQNLQNIFTFEETSEDEEPTDEKEDAQIPLDPAQILDTGRQFEGVASAQRIECHVIMTSQCCRICILFFGYLLPEFLGRTDRFRVFDINRGVVRHRHIHRCIHLNIFTCITMHEK